MRRRQANRTAKIKNRKNMNFNFDANIQKYAQNQYKIHNWFKEYKGIFAAILILKFFTSVVSVVAGYKFMYNTFYQIIPNENASCFFACFALILIELLSMYFIGKATKNFWHRRFVDCAKLGLGAALVFALSSYISIKGMVYFTSERVDNTEIIVNENKLLMDNLTAEHNDIIEQYKKSIQEIKNNPEGWVNGRRSVLTSAQQENIQRLNNYIKDENDRFYKERAELKEDKAASLTKNETETEEKSNNYGRYVAFIMLAQLITGIGVSYCCMKISLDGNEELEFSEVAKDVQDYAVNTIRHGLVKSMESVGASLATAIGINGDTIQVSEKNKNLIFARMNANQIPTSPNHGDPSETEQKAPETETPTAAEPSRPTMQKPIPTPQQPIGFSIPSTPQTDTENGPKTDNPNNGQNTDIAESAIRPKRTDTTSNPYGVAICPYCGKEFIRKTYNQKFCCVDHKNEFWKKQHPSDDMDEVKYKHNKRARK